MATLRPGFPWTIEAVAWKNLERQGFGLFLPTIVQEPEPGVVTPPMPMFPGYLFVAVAPDVSWSPVRSTMGIGGIIARPDGTPAWVPDAVMAVLLGTPQRRAPCPLGPLPVGLAVKITGGTFAGFDGVLHLDGASRVSVLLDLLGRRVPVQVPRVDVEPKGPGA